ncbi:mitochondrial ribosomal protein L49 [Trichomycterus rosablanca]|uniref:mitochondrial ribosomal protein L49 n=1 Tax=Trichomycterus rosablanca TaxID=2290929 RepID=UPI002F35C487
MAASIRGRTVTLSRYLLNKCRLTEKSRNIITVTPCLQVEGSAAGGVGGVGAAGGVGAVIESKEEFQYVERLIPPSSIPPPPKHTCTTPSGWTPPSVTPPSLPYMIRRSRMHNIPVYSDMKHGNQKSTIIRKVEGDIWALNKDVKNHLQQVTGRDTPTQVNEVTMSIRVKGEFNKELKDWILQHGF